MRLLFILLLMLAPCSLSWGTTRTVCAGGGSAGCDTTNVSHATNMSSAGDTVMVKSNTVEPAQVTAKARMKYLSFDMDRRDTIRFTNTDGIVVVDSVGIYGLTLTFTDDTCTSTRYLVRGGSGMENIQLRNCNVIRGAVRTPNKEGGVRFTSTTQTAALHQISIDSCYFNNVVVGYSEKGKKVRWNFLDTARLLCFGNDSVYYNTFTKTIGEIGLRGSDIYFGYNYVHSPGGEGISMDEAAGPKTVIFEYNVVDSNGHAPFCIDGMTNGAVRFNRFIRGAASYAIYQHGDPQDTVRSTQFRRNSHYLRGTNGAYGFSLTPNREIRSTRELFVGGGFGTYFKATTDTLDSAIATFSIISDSFTVWHDTLKPANVRTLLTDTLMMLPKSNKVAHFGANFSGWSDPLIRWKSLAYDVADDSFAVACSLSRNLWLYNPNRRDTGIVFLDTCTDTTGGGTWGKADSVILIADSTSVLKARGLNPSDSVWYRMRVNTTALTNSIRDTTYAYDTVTAAGSATMTIDSVRLVKTYRDSVIIYYVTNLSDSGAGTHAHINALSLGTPARWSGGQVHDTIPTDAPRGNYTPRLFNVADTLAVCPHPVRVLVPEAGKKP